MGCCAAATNPEQQTVSAQTARPGRSSRVIGVQVDGLSPKIIWSPTLLPVDVAAQCVTTSAIFSKHRQEGSDANVAQLANLDAGKTDDEHHRDIDMIPMGSLE